LIVQATAPSRIDLAGGTLDIYPLYLFEEGGITILCGGGSGRTKSRGWPVVPPEKRGKAGVRAG